MVLQAELYWHVTVKTAQFGAWVGALVGLAVGGIRRRPILTSFTNGCRNGMLIGLPMGVPMVYMRMSALNKVTYTSRIG